jgi:hypothetical protein
MNGADAPPPARLFTNFGTALYIDELGRLRHGPVQSSPANVTFVAMGGGAGPFRSGSIMHEAGVAAEPVICGSESCQALSALQGRTPSVGAVTLELTPLERGLIALSADGKFLCADPDGGVVLSRPACSAWECFLASEAWCSGQDMLPPMSAEQIRFDVGGVKRFVLDPLKRIRMNTASTRKKIVIYGHLHGANGRLYYDLAKQLHRQGYIADLLDWRQDHSGHMRSISEYYRTASRA